MALSKELKKNAHSVSAKFSSFGLDWQPAGFKRCLAKVLIRFG